MTNINSMLDFGIAVGVGAFFFSFYIWVFIFLYKNRDHLYTEEINEEVEDIPLEIKL